MFDVQEDDREFDREVIAEPMDWDRVLPLHAPRKLLGSEPEPDNARLLWRLRAWEIGCLPGQSSTQVRSWLHANGLGHREVSTEHDITVWRHPNGQREIGYMRNDYLYGRRRQPWVVVPTLTPLKVRPPAIRRRLFLTFDKFQTALSAGHEGQEPRRGKGLEPPCCPRCSRDQGKFVSWPCPALMRWMPPWLVRHLRAHIENLLKEAETETTRLVRQ